VVHRFRVQRFRVQGFRVQRFGIQGILSILYLDRLEINPGSKLVDGLKAD